MLGIVLPDNRAATIWSIAVNGVMAGCRPEYMPVLVALVEAMADPYYGVEHSGNTPGGETLIMLNGPIIKAARLQLHAGRDARRLPAEHLGRPLLAPLPAQRRGLPAAQERQGDVRQHLARRRRGERGRASRRSAGSRNSVDMGFAAGDNTVTISRYTGGNHISSRLRQHARGDAALSRGRRRAAVLVADHVHGRAGHGHAAAAHPARPDHRAHDRGLGLEQAATEALPVRARAACPRTSTSASCATGR